MGVALIYRERKKKRERERGLTNFLLLTSSPDREGPTYRCRAGPLRKEKKGKKGEGRSLRPYFYKIEFIQKGGASDNKERNKKREDPHERIEREGEKGREPAPILPGRCGRKKLRPLLEEGWEEGKKKEERSLSISIRRLEGSKATTHREGKKKKGEEGRSVPSFSIRTRRTEKKGGLKGCRGNPKSVGMRKGRKGGVEREKTRNIFVLILLRGLLQQEREEKSKGGKDIDWLPSRSKTRGKKGGKGRERKRGGSLPTDFLS